jgi:predicted nucleotidyltransferase
MPDAELATYIATLVDAHPGIREIWLIGSRANGTARPDSDWDLLAFADNGSLAALASDDTFNRHDIDLLVVFDGDRFRKPWLDGEAVKSGSLVGWEWERISDRAATYKAVKASEEDDFYVDITKGRAVRLWPQRS